MFPIAVVDQFLKENGLPQRRRDAPGRAREDRGDHGGGRRAFVEVEQYGTKYLLLDSVTTVAVKARLVDTRSGLLLWEGKRLVQQNASAGQSSLIGMAIAAAVTQILNTTTDAAHRLSPMVNVLLFNHKDQGLLYGPYHPRYNQPPE